MNSTTVISWTERDFYWQKCIFNGRTFILLAQRSLNSSWYKVAQKLFLTVVHILPNVILSTEFIHWVAFFISIKAPFINIYILIINWITTECQKVIHSYTYTDLWSASAANTFIVRGPLWSWQQTGILIGQSVGTGNILWPTWVK